MLACLALRGGHANEEDLSEDFSTWVHIHGAPTFEKLFDWSARFQAE
jgi:hypothetical protein